MSDKRVATGARAAPAAAPAPPVALGYTHVTLYNTLNTLPAEMIRIIDGYFLKFVNKPPYGQAYRDLTRGANGEYDGIVYATDEPNAFCVVGHFDSRRRLVCGIEYRPANMPMFKFDHLHCVFARRPAGVPRYSRPYLIRYMNKRVDVEIELTSATPSSILRVLSGQPYNAALNPCRQRGANYRTYRGGMVLGSLMGQGELVLTNRLSERGTFLDGILHGPHCARMKRDSARVGEFDHGTFVHGSVHLAQGNVIAFLHGQHNNLLLDEKEEDEELSVNAVVGLAGSITPGDWRAGIFSLAGPEKYPIGTTKYEAREYNAVTGWKRLSGTMRCYLTPIRNLPTMTAIRRLAPPSNSEEKRQAAHLFEGFEYFEGKAHVTVREHTATYTAPQSGKLVVTSVEETAKPIEEKDRLAKIQELTTGTVAPVNCMHCGVAFEDIRRATLAFRASRSAVPPV